MTPSSARLETLDPQIHGRSTVKAMTDFGFAATLNAVLLTGIEFVEAARELPVFFIQTSERDAQGRLRLAAVAGLGLAQGDNLMVEGGRWLARHLPASLRRAPFMLVPSAQQDRMAVCIDRDHPLVSTGEGRPLFTENGQPSAFLTDILRFLEAFQGELHRTQMFCDRLQGLDLLAGLKLEFDLPGGGTHPVDGVMVVDEKKLLALPDADVLALHRDGTLAWVHARLLSLGHFNRLVDRHLGRHHASA